MSTDSEDAGWLQSAALSKDGNLVYLADSEGTLSCYDRRAGTHSFSV